MTRGEGFMPWQSKRRESAAERRFREQMERRKDKLLAGRQRVRHPALITEEQISRARTNITTTAWGGKWWRGVKAVADHVVRETRRDAGYIEHMIPRLTPTNPYPFTCPNCVGRLSQEGVGGSHILWDRNEPDVIRCKSCQHALPSADYPETGRLVCPRRDQTFTYYQNDAERAHPNGRSGKYAWTWVGKPANISYSGIVRQRKILFMLEAARSLGLACRFTYQPEYAATAARVLDRMADCCGNWLYHDFYNTIADCDPLYAAWHDRSLKLEWKRNSYAFAYEGSRYETGPVEDTMNKAKMLATFFGCGRVHPSADTTILDSICLAYDLTRDAVDGAGRPIWTAARRRHVERNLILEQILTGEPFCGDLDKPTNVNNKAPYVYRPMAHVARTLGIADYAHTALAGWEAIRDRSFLLDGFSRETPGYTMMFINGILPVPEILHGFRWPKSFKKRRGTVDVFGRDPMMRQIMMTAISSLRPDGRYLPLSDTLETGGPDARAMEIGLKRYPDLFVGKMPVLYRGAEPTEYAVFNHSEKDLTRDTGLDLPESIYSDWMTAILRHGSGARASVLAMAFNPTGGHRQGDNLTLYYADRGQTLLGELGYVNDSAMLTWGASTFSHNLVVVDDEEQPGHYHKPGERTPKLRLAVTSPRVSLVEAESAVYSQCKVYRRKVVLIKDPSPGSSATFAVDLFRVRGGSKHAYRLSSELAASDAAVGSLQFEGLDMPAEQPLPDFGASIEPEHVFGLRDVRSVEQPPDAWTAQWKERGRRYRLHVLSPADQVQASNGPGQETIAQAGRRLRYLDVIRQGADLSSNFVAIHEPSGPRGAMPIDSARRLDVPARAGFDAVALRIVCRWGTYLILSAFGREAEVEGVRFRGAFGILCEPTRGRRWLLAAGSETLMDADGFGFENAPDKWSGRVAEQSRTHMMSDSPCPRGWPDSPDDVTSYVLMDRSGWPVTRVGRRRITVDQFPLQNGRHFHLPATQFVTER
jgi:hypothetical protein